MGIRFSSLPVIGLFVIVTVVVGVVFGMRFGANELKREKNCHNRAAKIWQILIILFVIIAILSWILNMGWYRFVLTLVLAPVIHAVFFAIVNIKSAEKAVLFPKMKKYMVLSCATYLLAYLLFPDAGDIGEMYLFFGLIKSDAIVNVLIYVAPIIFIVNGVILVLQSFALGKCRPQ
jgi:hypothetical protein